MSGIGIKKAEAIIAYREANGHFESISQLAKVKGIGSKTIDRNHTVIQVLDTDNKID
jgi:competence protein ComEA